MGARLMRVSVAASVRGGRPARHCCLPCPCGDLVRAGDESQRPGEACHGARERERPALGVPDHGGASQPAPRGEVADVLGELGERPAGCWYRGAQAWTAHRDQAHPECLDSAGSDAEPTAGGRARTQQDRNTVWPSPFRPAEQPPVGQPALPEPGGRSDEPTHDPHHDRGLVTGALHWLVMASPARVLTPALWRWGPSWRVGRDGGAVAAHPLGRAGQTTWSRACISLISACCALMICWARLWVAGLLPWASSVWDTSTAPWW